MSYRLSPEFTARTFQGLPPQVVNGATAGGSGVGFSVQEFTGDVVVEVNLGTLAASSDLDINIETAPLDADGSAPESGDFSALLNTAGVSAKVAGGLEGLTNTDSNKVLLVRISRHLCKAFLRVTAVEAGSQNAAVGVVIRAHLPQYDSASDGVAAAANFALIK